MKKFYTILTLLTALLLGGMTTVKAQNDELIEFAVNAKAGDWTACNPARTWASAWASVDQDLGIAIKHAKGNNNMAFWDGFNIQFYSSVGSSTTNEDYYIIPSKKYYVAEISFDFVAGKHPSYAFSGVAVSIDGGDPVENESDSDPVHIEATDLDPTQSQAVFNVATIGDTPTFANTSNFIVRLHKRSREEVAELEFAEVLNEYGNYDRANFPTGTEPGMYTEAALDAFFAAMEAAYATEDLPESERTADLLEKLIADIQNTYEALLASKIMTLSYPAGYYRIKAAMEYTNEVPTGEKDEDGFDIMESVEKTKFMLGEKSGNDLSAVWGDLEDDNVELQTRALWRISPLEEKAENGANVFTLSNVFNEAGFTTISTSAKVVMKAGAGELMAFEPAMTEEGVTYINIRVAAQEIGYTYLHQSGHKSGLGVSGDVVGWEPSYSVTNGPGGTEWVLEKVDDAEAEQIIAAFIPIRERQEFEAAYVALKADAVVALNKAKDFIVGTEGIITDPDQFSSPWSDADEGADFGALIDNDASTFWHSDWHNGSVPVHTHYLQVALADDAYELLQLTMTRRNAANDHITQWGVYGSNDAEADDADWTKVATLDMPFGKKAETLSAAPFNPRGYKNLRFYIDNTTGTKGNSRGYGHMAEFQLFEAKVNPTSQYALMGDAAKTLDDVLAAQENVEVSEITEEQAAALQAAYDAFLLKYVDPADLRSVIASVEGIADGMVIGTNPGYWTDTNVANELKKVVAEARAYDEAGVYVAEQSNELIRRLNEQGDLVRAAAISVQPGKWYRIRFGTEAEFEKGGWDLVAGSANVDANDVEIDEALWGKYITCGDYEQGENGENLVNIVDADQVRMGDNVFFDAAEDVSDKDEMLFRFVAVGDTAYILQNKATGFFLRAAGTSGFVRHSIHPSLFSVSPIGYGQNLIAARDLEGNKQNYLHAQKQYNVLVTWDAYTPGSRSALYIEEAGDVEANYDGTEFTMDMKTGQLYTMCYPVSLSIEEEDGVMYTVNEAKGGNITLAPIQGTAAAGRPFIYILGDTESYDPEADANEITFRHGYEVAAAPDTLHALRGTYTQIDQVGAGYLIVDEHNPTQFAVTRNLMGGTVAANTAYIVSDEKLSISADITVEIPEDAVDGIQTALRNISRAGTIYTMDGRVAAKGNLNTLRTLPKGVYILNGTKVTIK
ncbi:MAG: discoidin domain-containing protein [Bacteroidaceae bacterium]|nr:discoidin domain-containing protein [Bacteroidaceae bacterium]